VKRRKMIRENSYFKGLRKSTGSEKESVKNT
jgi:hypothetical protein